MVKSSSTTSPAVNSRNKVLSPHTNPIRTHQATVQPSPPRHKQWLIKNHEVVKVDFDNLWIITKLFAFDAWRLICKQLEMLSQTKFIINPLYDDNALISFDKVPTKEFIGEEKKWQTRGKFHIKFEKWDSIRHSRPLVIKGFGGWIKIKNLPSDLWQRSISEAIGDRFGGLIDIATKTLNLTNCSKAQILVKKNICGFVSSTIEISDHKRGSIFLRYGDFEFLNPPNTSIAPSLQGNFSNSIDRLHIREVLNDEGLDISSFPLVINVPKSVFAVLPNARNPFSLLKPFPASSPVPLPDKKTEIGAQLAAFSNGRASEQFLPITNPLQHSCLQKVMGHTEIKLNPLFTAASDPPGERNIVNAP